MATFLEFIESLSRPWVYRPFLTGIIIGLVCAIIGVFIILRGLVFFGNGIAHSAFAGGALGLLLGINPLITISIFAISTSVGIGYINQKAKLTNETAIGILFSFSMGLGVLFIQMYNTYNTDISSLLFGSLSSISLSELLISLIFGAIILGITFFMKKELYFITFDEELAKANGMPVKALNYVFLVTVALTIVMSITTVGTILVMAFIVTPAATAYQFTYKFNKLILLSALISVTGSIIGFALAYMFNLSASATIAIILTIFFGIAMLISPKRRRKKPDIDEQFCNVCEHLVEGVNCKYCELEKMANNCDAFTKNSEINQKHDHEHNHGHHHS